MTVVTLKPVDIVVVGMGVAGTILCKELAPTGLRIVGLERGRMVDSRQEFALPKAQDELTFASDTDLMQNLARETITFRNAMNETALPMREIGSFMPGECVGGAGVRWGALAGRFLPWDFETRSRTLARYGDGAWPEECVSRDWGITYDELEPYYDQFECVYGVGGRAGNIEGDIRPGGNPFEGARSREFPNPPAPTTHAGSLFAAAAASLGHHPFPQPTAAMTRPYVNPYRLMLGECGRAGFCVRHGCPKDAKATPLTAVLPALLRHANFELRPRANVLKVNLDSQGKRATGVTYVDARGRRVEQPADLVILASFTFSNTRLMLLSGIGAPYDPASGRGVIGKGYSYQPTRHLPLFFEDRSFNCFMGGGGFGTVIDEFNGDNFDHTGLGFIGGAKMAVTSMGAAPIRSHPVPDGTPRWGSGWKKAVARYYDRSFQITIEAGCQSYRTNHLDLDPTYRDVHGLPLVRMTFDWHDNERRALDHITRKALDIATAIAPSALGAGSALGKYDIVPYQSTHNAGGVAMGADPDSSAVNKHLQSWDVDNVFVVGASAFPQNSANNPTETVGALAFWVADAIKECYLKRPGRLV